MQTIVTQPAPARPDQPWAGSRNAARGDLAQAGFVLGIVAWVAVFVPPGLFVAPVCALVATILGIVALGRGERGSGRAVAGLVLGATALVASAGLLWAFHGVILRAIHQINAHAAML